jgi:hypothetical protein
MPYSMLNPNDHLVDRNICIKNFNNLNELSKDVLIDNSNKTFFE